MYDYLPNSEEIDVVDKAFICNVCNTLLTGEVLAIWAKKQIEEMNIDVTKQKED